VIRGAALLALVACTSMTPPPSTTPPPAAQPHAPTAVVVATIGTAPILPVEVSGLWTGDWGPMYLQVTASGDVHGVYAYQGGVIDGRLTGDTIRGLWCEPAVQRVGQVEFTIAATDAGLRIDGRWRAESEGPWAEDWDLVHSDDPVDAALRARFDDPAATCDELTPVTP
jgi:hypothetical protein